MTDADFLRAIIDQPDDDTPRLMYADWLEERGDPLGELIRRQFALNCGHTTDIADLWVNGKSVRWADVVGWPECLHGTIRRGFVEAVTCSAADWIEHAAAIRTKQPVRDVKLSGGLIISPELFRSSLGLRKLRLNDNLEYDTSQIAATLKAMSSSITAISEFVTPPRPRTRPRSAPRQP